MTSFWHGLMSCPSMAMTSEKWIFARDVAYTYTKPMEHFENPRGGIYQAGLYPVSANVPLGAQTGATPDGRLANTPIADGVGPAAGRDVNGPTSTVNSVAIWTTG